MKENFLNKSKANIYKLTDEYSEFADKVIKETIFKLLNYFANKSLTIVDKKTYNIILQNKTLKTASYTVKIRGKNIPDGYFEISNPFEFEGARIWTTYKNLGKFWTNIKLLTDNDLHPDILAYFLIQDYQGAYDLINQNRKYSEDFYDIESFIEDEIDEQVIEDQVLKVFTKLFNTK